MLITLWKRELNMWITLCVKCRIIVYKYYIQNLVYFIESFTFENTK